METHDPVKFPEEIIRIAKESVKFEKSRSGSKYGSVKDIEDIVKSIIKE